MSYSKGRSQEYAAGKWLRKHGWRVIGRFAGSKPVDLLARDQEGQLWLVEVKYGSGRLTQEDALKLEVLAISSGLPILTLHRKRRGRWTLKRYFEPDVGGDEAAPSFASRTSCNNRRRTSRRTRTDSW